MRNIHCSWLPLDYICVQRAAVVVDIIHGYIQGNWTWRHLLKCLCPFSFLRIESSAILSMFFPLQVVWRQPERWCTASAPSTRGRPGSRSSWWGDASLPRASLWSPSSLESSPQPWNPSRERRSTTHPLSPVDWSYLSGWNVDNFCSLVVILCNGQQYLLLPVWQCFFFFCSGKSIMSSSPVVSKIIFVPFCLANVYINVLWRYWDKNAEHVFPFFTWTPEYHTRLSF